MGQRWLVRDRLAGSAMRTFLTSAALAVTILSAGYIDPMLASAVSCAASADGSGIGIDVYGFCSAGSRSVMPPAIKSPSAPKTSPKPHAPTPGPDFKYRSLCTVVVRKGGRPPDTRSAPKGERPTPQMCAARPSARLNPQSVRQTAIRLLPRIAIGAAPHPDTLVNAQTILWAATPSRRSLPVATVAGQRVRLRITLAESSWVFGDGDSAVWHTGGKPYDAKTDPCESARCPGYDGHVYRRTGRVTVELRVLWSAQFSVNGKQWTPVPGGTIAGPPSTIELTVRQARGVLVSEPS